MPIRNRKCDSGFSGGGQRFPAGGRSGHLLSRRCDFACAGSVLEIFVVELVDITCPVIRPVPAAFFVGTVIGSADVTVALLIVSAVVMIMLADLNFALLNVVSIRLTVEQVAAHMVRVIVGVSVVMMAQFMEPVRTWILCSNISPELVAFLVTVAGGILRGVFAAMRDVLSDIVISAVLSTVVDAVGAAVGGVMSAVVGVKAGVCNDIVKMAVAVVVVCMMVRLTLGVMIFAVLCVVIWVMTGVLFGAVVVLLSVGAMVTVGFRVGGGAMSDSIGFAVDRSDDGGDVCSVRGGSGSGSGDGGRIDGSVGRS